VNKIKKILLISIIILISSPNAYAEIKDSLLVTVGNAAITKSDIYNEIKIILILNNLKFTEEQKIGLQKMAIKSTIKRTIKNNELKKRNITQYNKKDLNHELNKIATRINMDIETLKKICESNQLNFSLIEDQIKTELMWNTLVFGMYSDKLSINIDEIDEKLKLLQNKKFYTEYLISEIVVESVAEENLKTTVDSLINKIDKEGFEKVAIDLSVSETALKGGDLGWLSENEISNEIKLKLSKTNINEITEPVLIPEGIILFKVRDKRKIEKKIDLEKMKNQLVSIEKIKVLDMFSRSYFDSIKRSTPIKFFE
jgi:peptidyl-prolyl cis-trans isomerase SurA